MSAPYSYQYINEALAFTTPSTVHVRNTALSKFFRRYLLQRAFSVFKWTLPPTWSRDYFLYTLYCWGYITIVNTDKFGVIPQGCGLKGLDVFYRPTNAIITNPLLRGILEPRIGTECVLLKIAPDYHGIGDLVGYYGDMLALCAETVGINLLNSHLATVFFAEDKTMAESFKKLYDQVSEGNPAAVVDKHLLTDDGKPKWCTFVQNAGQNLIADKVWEIMRKLQNAFDTEIGIPNANTEKRERMLYDEINANNVETFSRSALILESLKEGCSEARAMFDINIDVNWRVDPERRMVNYG